MSFVDDLMEMMGSIDSKDGQAKPVSQPVKQPVVNVSPTALQLDTWAMAWLNGGTVTPECLEILSHVLTKEVTRIRTQALTVDE